MAFPIFGDPKPTFFLGGVLAANGTVTIKEPSDDTNKASYPTADDADAAINANKNPVELNSAGQPANGIWGIDDAKYKVTVSNGATSYTVDDVRMPGSSYVSVATHGATGDGSTDDTAAIAAAKVAGDYIYLPEGSYLTSTKYDYTTEFFGPGTLVYTGGSNHNEKLGQVIHAGDYRNIGGETNAKQSGGFLAGAPSDHGSGFLMGAQEHPHWQIWRTVNSDSSDDGTLHWDILPNVPVVNAISATHNSGTDTKLTALTNDFSDDEIWAVNQLIQFNLVKYRVKSRIDNDNIVLGTDATTPLAVAWTSAFTDNVTAPRFVWNVTGTISGSNLAITAGDHPPSFSNFDYSNNRVYALISSTWIRVTASVSSISLTLSSSPGNATGAAVKIRLEPDYTFQLGFKRASGQGLEETLRIESHSDGYLFRSTGSGVAVTKPIYFEMESNITFLIHPGGELYGFGTRAPKDYFDLENLTANSNINIRMTNDAQSWKMGLAGASADRWILRDITGSKDIIQIDVGATADSLYIRSNRVETDVPFRLQSYTVSGVPSASGMGAGALIYVTDETGGATVAASNGTNWQRVTDLTNIA